MSKFDRHYWESRYAEEQTGWDTASITQPLKVYFDQLEDKSIKILIPGCGNAHEAAYLYNCGFKNIFICDWAVQPLENFTLKNPLFPKNQLIHSDFFQLSEKHFDLIVEQTFFCALDPVLRPDYVRKMKELLKPGGKLVGLLFDFPLSEKGPPFGADEAEYLSLFSTHFQRISIEKCHNSIKPRKDSEFFIRIS